MALLKSGSYRASGTVDIAYKLYAEQTGGSGNSRTVKVTAEFKCGGSSAYPSWWGYATNWRPFLSYNGSPVYGTWKAIKGTESWNTNDSYRSFSQTLTINVGTTSSVAILVGFATDSSGDNGWDGSTNASFTVGSTNVAPTLSGTIATSPSGTISEKQASISLTIPAASDTNLKGYRVSVSVNGGGYSQIYDGSARTCSHTISGYGEGTTFKYSAYAYDSVGAKSSTVYSAVVTKNKFTMDSFTSSSSIGFSTGNTTLSFAFSGASNTTGNTTFTRKITCDGVTVYNQTVTTSPISVVVYRSGTLPTGAYVKFDDIKNKFAAAGYKGTLNFKLSTTNAYGTTKENVKAISVNLQTTPNAVTSQTINANTNSTAYLQVASTSNKYFLPNGSNYIRVSWSGGSGKLGEAIKYEVYVSYGAINSDLSVSWGGYQKIADVASGTTYYNHYMPKQNVKMQFKYLVRTVCLYNTQLYSDAVTGAQTVDYYNLPTFSTGTITRGATSAEVKFNISSFSSIPNINIIYTWKAVNQVGGAIVDSITIATSRAQGAQTLTVNNLTDEGKYNLTVTFKDDTGFSIDTISPVVAIGANSPLFFINKYGAGVNGAKADAQNALVVKGKIRADGIEATISLGANVNLNDLRTAGEYSQHANANTSLALNYPEAMAGHLTVTTGAGVQQRYHVYNSSRVYTRAQYDSGAWTSWAKEYNTLNKPTAADIGAAASSHSHGYLPTSGGTVSGTLEVSNIVGLSVKRSDLAGHYARVQASSTAGDVLFGHSTSPTADVNYYMRLKSGGGDLQLGTTSIVASGNSSTGRWVRFYDGTQIVWRNHTNTYKINTAYGSVFYHNTYLNFPVTFVETPSVTASCISTGVTSIAVNGINTSKVDIRLVNPVSTELSCTITIIVVGRWK